MNKKIVFLLVAVFSILFVIIVSVFGKVPDNGSRVPVQSIIFVDNSTDDGFCKTNDNGEKIIYIQRGTAEYQLEYLINPEAASEKEVTFQIISGGDNASVDENGLITFNYEATITVKIYSNMIDFKSDIVIIEFKGNNSSVIPGEDDPF